MTIRIPDGNAFRIRLTARNLITGEYTEAADLSNIDNLVINYVRRGIRFPHAYTIDEEGRATVADAGTLDCGFYGIELTGYYGGEKFRFYGKDLFEITTDTTDVIDPSNLIDIEITVKLNASGVSKDYVDHAVNGMEASMETMQADLRDEIAEAGKVDDVKVNGVSVVSGKKANITVPTKVSDLTNDSGYQTAEQVEQAVNGLKINSVGVSVDNNTGVPSGSGTIIGQRLEIELHNIIGAPFTYDDFTPEQLEELRGPQGPQGDSVLVGQGDLPLANTIGYANDKAITQKAVTDELVVTHEEDKSDATLTNGYIKTDGTYTSGGSKTAATEYINCEGAAQIEISMIVLTTSPTQYLAFYSTNSASGYMSHIARITGAAEGTEIHTYDIPKGAKYFRTTYWNAEYSETYGDFHCKLIFPSVKRLDKVEEDIETIVDELGNISNDLQVCEDELFEEVRKAGSETETITIPNWTNNTSVSAINGKTKSSESTKCTGYIDISAFYSLNYSRLRLSTVKTSHTGIAFYDENYVYVSGQEGAYYKTKGVEDATVVVPTNAKYARFTAWKDEQSYGEFSLEGTNVDYETVARYARDIEILNTKIDSVDGNSQIMKLDQMDIVELNEIVADGTHSPNSDMGCTDYIPCLGAKLIKYTRVVSPLSGAGIAFYDDDKVYIDGSYVDSETGDNGMVIHTVSVPQSASYFRATGWNYVNSKTYGEFQASFDSPSSCIDGNRASNGDCTYFSVVYNAAIDNLAASDFNSPSLGENYVCTTAVVLLPDDYTPDGKPSRVIINFHGWSHYVHYKQWGVASSLGFMMQKRRWAAAGYAVIDINHKNSAQGGGYSGLGSIQDDECYRKAFEWVKNHYNVEDTCFIVCGSAGGPNGINACYNWPEVRCGVWLDVWADVSAHPYVNGCGTYYYGYTDAYDASKVGTRNPATRIVDIGGVEYLQMPPCPVKIYHLTPSYDGVLVNIIKAGHAIGGDYIVRTCTGISHSDLVSGGDGDNPKSAIVDEEIINYLNQH